MHKTVFTLGCSIGNPGWQQSAKDNGIDLIALDTSAVESKEKAAEIREQLRITSDAKKSVLLFADHGMQEGLGEFLSSLPEKLIQIPLGSDALLISRGNAPSDWISILNTYLTYGGDENIRGLVEFLRYHVFEDTAGGLPRQPVIIPFDGIYQEDSDRVFESAEAFLAQEKEKYPVYVGMLSHRSFWLNHTLQPEYALISALHKKNVGVIPVFSAGEASELMKSYDFSGIKEHFFSINGKLMIQGLVNFQIHLIKGQGGMSIAETSSALFESLGIPVFHPVSSYSVGKKQWEQSNHPLASELQSDYLNPEMAGMTEPVLLALRDEKQKSYIPIQENAELLAGRIQKWLNLRMKPNREKKIAIMLNNAVCSGVEATLGKSFGLDGFQSTVLLMKRLEKEGYDVRNIPRDGEALRSLLLEKKAFADFRWTSTQDILNSGGCIYRMPTTPEYEGYLKELPEQMQKAMLDTWGTPPGEGMVAGKDLVITGLRFGNVTVLVQPKRGCYGPKCTGEVCRILHDPLCPPAHQYLATYRYLERVWQADAVIHMGTDGSLEYLPGKASGLGTESWTYGVLGTLPNLYPYHLGVPSEAAIAKRRASAVLLGYYPASFRGLEEQELTLLEKLDAYVQADDLQNGQENFLKQEIENALSPALRKLMESAPSFRDGVTLARSTLLHAAEGRKISDLHIFGENPTEKEAISYLCEVLRGEERLKKESQEEEADYHRRLMETVKAALKGGSDPYHLQEIYEKLQKTQEELDQLLLLLSGGYLSPSESGMPDENGRKILPTGRNFYGMNGDKIPTPTAFQRGRILAEQLLNAYLEDEGAYPKKIAMNMISLDISRTNGEQMCQFLYLLGVTPVWDHKGRVQKLMALPLSQLGRPRMDVTLRISGVMRDTWPDAVKLMDEAVMLVSGLPETEEENYVLANIHAMEQECGKMADRDKTIRIFGDPPGAFGAGIDLALKASAWENDKDLARYFIESSAFAYGKELDGRKSVREFVENAKTVDLTCDVTSSRRMDTLSCGFGVQVHGGFKLVAETIGKKKVRQYQSISELGEQAQTTSLSQRIEEDTAQTLLNVCWQEHVQAQGYTGAAEIMQRVQTAFDAQCTSQVLRDETLDQLAETYLSDGEMRQWLLENNPYAAEEIGRRLLELQSRGKWQPNEEVLDRLRENYLSIEGFMEGGVTGDGELQGGSVEIVRDDQVEAWHSRMKDVDSYLSEMEKKS